MSSMNDAASLSSNFPPILSAALANYLMQTGKDLQSDPLSAEIQRCNSPNEILNVFKKIVEKLDEYSRDDSKLTRYLNHIVDGMYALSTNPGLSAAASLAFPPAQLVFSGISILLAAAKGVKGSHDTLVDVFECFEIFLTRLTSYTRPEIKPTPAMTEVLVKILTEFLSVLSLATKWMNEGRLKKFAKKLLGDNDVQAVLRRIDRLTQEESRATAVQTLEIIHGLVNNMTVVMEDGKASMESIRQALVLMQRAAEQINKTNRDQLQETFRRWLSPPDPSTNHNIARKAHHDGTALWFIQGDTFKEWKVTGSLLWIHGNPGCGKSVLCSTIIREVQDLHDAGLATFAYFYFDFRDASKRDTHSFLSSLLVQICAQYDPFCEILSALYSKYDHGSRQPSDDTLLECLKKMFELPEQGPLYLIIDALDECPNSSGFPTQREQALDIVQELANLPLPYLHLCITSRPEMDIRGVLEPLAVHNISLHNESGQNQDIIDYIHYVVRSDPKMRKWREDDRVLVIDTLTLKAGGMFRWVHCQIETLRRCFPQSIKRALNELPRTLDETYDRTLQDIDEEKQGYTYRLFQCLTVSIRPLRLKELVEVLAIQLDAETMPGFDADWRPEDAEEAVMSACSTLVTIVEDGYSKFVQFSHFTVKEYLTSSRLANSRLVSQYHIALLSAHTFLARACLCILLQLDDTMDRNHIEDFPLAQYGARYWIGHAQFESVSSLIQDEMDYLFDKDKPHFACWVWLYDIDKPWMSLPFTSSTSPGQPDALPLYYAALCGFRDIIQRLISTRPEEVHARGGRHVTPLHAALARGHLEVVLFLLENGVDVDTRDNEGATPLHLASRSRDARVMTALLDRGADPNSVTDQRKTSLLIASETGDVVAARLLLEYGADMNLRDEDHWSALEKASECGNGDIVQLLLDHGANADEQDEYGLAPLHFASRIGQIAIARMLLDRGASVNIRDRKNMTSLHVASELGYVEVVRLLLDRGADVNAQDDNLFTPLHVAVQYGHFQVAEVLLEHDVNLHLKNNSGKTPLQVALEWSDDELAQLLSKRAGERT